jgi:hypothetical protein
LDPIEYGWWPHWPPPPEVRRRRRRRRRIRGGGGGRFIQSKKRQMGGGRLGLLKAINPPRLYKLNYVCSGLTSGEAML